MMVLNFCEQYLSNSAVLSLLPLTCNHGKLTLKLYIWDCHKKYCHFKLVDSKSEVYQEW